MRRGSQGRPTLKYNTGEFDALRPRPVLSAPNIIGYQAAPGACLIHNRLKSPSCSPAIYNGVYAKKRQSVTALCVLL
jgi:hypothetical protein